MRVQLDEICKRIYAGGDVPKDRFSHLKTPEHQVPIYANAEKEEGLYGFTDKAREYDIAVTVAARGTIGYTAIRTEPFLPVVRLITVVPDLNRITPKYLYYALKNCRPESSGTSIPQLTVPDIKKYAFNLCELNRQNEITDVLDTISGIIDRRNSEIQMLDDLIKARFVEMFGDPEVNPHRYPVQIIGSLVTDIIPGWSANGESRQKLESEKAVLKVSAVTQGYFKPEEHKALPANTEIKKYVYPHKGDLLFSRANTRELVGATAIIEEDYPDLILPDKLWRVLLSDELNVYYAKYVLSSASVRAEFSAQSTTAPV